jgi:hypothetical protein
MPLCSKLSFRLVRNPSRLMTKKDSGQAGMTVQGLVAKSEIDAILETMSIMDIYDKSEQARISDKELKLLIDILSK